jgi:hypothetical protein
MTPDEMMMLDATMQALPRLWGDMMMLDEMAHSLPETWGDAAALDHAINNEMPGA